MNATAKGYLIYTLPLRTHHVDSYYTRLVPAYTLSKLSLFSNVSSA